MKLDPKEQLDGVLYSQSATLHVARQHDAAVQKLATVKLELQPGAAPQAAAVRSTPDFDLVLNVPRSHMAEQRKRLEKERDQLEKNIVNSNRQLGDEKFLSRAPAPVIESLKTKLADYETQLAKVRKALNGFPA
jgi:valyl-tRNA synthetase